MTYFHTCHKANVHLSLVFSYSSCSPLILHCLLHTTLWFLCRFLWCILENWFFYFNGHTCLRNSGQSGIVFLLLHSLLYMECHLVWNLMPGFCFILFCTLLSLLPYVERNFSFCWTEICNYTVVIEIIRYVYSLHYHSIFWYKIVSSVCIFFYTDCLLFDLSFYNTFI